MKYKNGTVVEITNTSIMPEYGLDPSVKMVLKTGRRTYISFGEDAGMHISAEGTNKLFDKLGEAYPPEHVAIMRVPEKHHKDDAGVGDILYVDVKYYKEAFGFEPVNVYPYDSKNGTTPVLVLTTDNVMFLDDSGISIELPMKLEKLAKHSPLWTRYDVDNFSVTYGSYKDAE